MKKLVLMLLLGVALNIKAVPTFDYTTIQGNLFIAGITFDAGMFAVVERSVDGGATWIFLNSYGFQDHSYSYIFQYDATLAPSTMFRLRQF